MKKLLLFVLITLSASLAGAQGIAYSGQITNSQGIGLPGVTVNVFTITTTGNPAVVNCVTPATVFKDLAMTQPYTVLLTNGFGAFYFFSPANVGSLGYQVTGSPTADTNCYPLAGALPGGNPSYSSVSTTIGPNTLTGTTTLAGNATIAGNASINGPLNMNGFAILNAILTSPTVTGGTFSSPSVTGLQINGNTISNVPVMTTCATFVIPANFSIPAIGQPITVTGGSYSTISTGAISGCATQPTFTVNGSTVCSIANGSFNCLTTALSQNIAGGTNINMAVTSGSGCSPAPGNPVACITYRMQ
jgi:hypothetical protein